MKKIILIVVLMCAAFSANAQDLYLGGNVTFWHNDSGENDLTTITLAPELGYNLNEKWALGIELDFTHYKVNSGKVNIFTFSPYARYSYYTNGPVRLFLDGGFGVMTASVSDWGSGNGFEIGIKPGIAIEISKKFSLISKIGFLGYRDDYLKGNTIMDIKANEALATNGFGFSLKSTDISIGFLVKF